MSDDVGVTKWMPLPDACVLRPVDGPPRLERWQRLVRQAHVETNRRDDAIVVSFEDGAGVGEELLSLAAAESECCSFLCWDVTAESGHLVLIVTSPTGDSAELDSVAGLWTAI